MIGLFQFQARQVYQKCQNIHVDEHGFYGAKGSSFHFIPLSGLIVFFERDKPIKENNVSTSRRKLHAETKKNFASRGPKKTNMALALLR